MVNLRSQSMTNEECECACACVYICDMQRAEGPSRLETLSRGQIIYKWGNIDDFSVCAYIIECVDVWGRDVWVCVCGGEKISVLPAFSHSRANWRNCQESQHEGPSMGWKSCKWDIAELMPIARWDMMGMDLYIVFYNLIFRFWDVGKLLTLQYVVKVKLSNERTHSALQMMEREHKWNWSYFCCTTRDFIKLAIIIADKSSRFLDWRMHITALLWS